MNSRVSFTILNQFHCNVLEVYALYRYIMENKLCLMCFSTKFLGLKFLCGKAAIKSALLLM